MNTLTEAETFIKKAKKDDLVILYHSGDASINESLSSGIESNFGKWREEMLNMSVDDEYLEEKLRENGEISFFCDEPKWVAMKAARAIDKTRNEITLEDIEKHGQLCIVGVDPDDYDFKFKKDYENTTYLNGEKCFDETPFGVEPGDFFSTAKYNPVDITLTGKELVSFILNKFPELNKTKEIKENQNIYENNKNFDKTSELEM